MKARKNKTKHRSSDDVCLQCEQTRTDVRQSNAVCALERGYEHPDTLTEWPEHRWEPWANADLVAFGVYEKFYELYRKTPARKLRYLPCEHTINGHIWGVNTYAEVRCIWCEVKAEKIKYSGQLPTSSDVCHTDVNKQQQLKGN